MIFSALVKRVRKRGGLTQEDLGSVLLVSAQTVSNWESGRANPDLGTGAILLRLDFLSRAKNFRDTLWILKTQCTVRSGARRYHQRTYDMLIWLFRTCGNGEPS